MSNMVVSNLKCRICDNSLDNKAYNIREMMFGRKDMFTYYQCSRCKCLQIMQSPDEIAQYYPPDYYSFSPSLDKKYSNKVNRAFLRIRTYLSVMRQGLGGMLMRSIFPNDKLKALAKVNLTAQSRILDVGCGSGSLLYALREAGFINLLGIDPYLEKDINYDNGLQILRKTIHDLQDEYDVVMYHHSFEHISDPLRELTTVSRRLSPGGICMIRIPTVSSFAWDHYRENWYQIDAPRHYFLHSVESMKLLADRAGFHIQRIVYDSTVDQFRGSELYAMGIPFVSGSEAKHVFSKAQIRAWKRGSRQLNREGRGDQAVFYLVKL